jgi:nitrogen regulatory protein PII
MKEIVAVIRPSRSKVTKQKLAEGGFPAYTELRVSGRGKQRGLSYASGGAGIPFLPKRMLLLCVNDDDAARAVEILVQENRSGEIGDGKIFISPIKNVLRIRTDEKDRVALI